MPATLADHPTENTTPPLLRLRFVLNADCNRKRAHGTEYVWGLRDTLGWHKLQSKLMSNLADNGCGLGMPVWHLGDAVLTSTQDTNVNS